MSARTLTRQAYRTPEKVDNFQKSNLAARILLLRLVDFRRARRTNTMACSLLRPIWLELEHLGRTAQAVKPPSSGT